LIAWIVIVSIFWLIIDLNIHTAPKS
jgi:hypothetical protein